MGVSAFFLLSSLGLAITAQAQNCSRPVGNENMSLKGEDILKDTFPDGGKATFACNVGYRAAIGSPSVTCSAGVWSPTLLQCEKKNCGSLGQLNNGDIDYVPGTEFGDKAVIRCNTGHILVGNEEIICGDKGWMGRLPECEVMTCNPPAAIADGTFIPVKEVYNFGDVVVYSCPKDYTLNGSRELSCSLGGKFSHPAPKCVRVECADISEIPNGRFKEGSRPPHKYKATIMFECNQGYEMTGSPTLTCEINNQWSPELPKCTGNGGSSQSQSWVVPVVIVFSLATIGCIAGVIFWKKRSKHRKPVVPTLLDVKMTC
ncbi:regulator of complement activation group 2 gene 1 isoform X6 [Cololabis saira]|uniref:regulator of complement activation group 2 gene 1 isoform X6 n=1 Tax=Cololabis saira TaxID=129043 RepID=UPI002AD294D2|nr:regulator of complement activation group 2 gene 1 isoform X6 [Cololabis saira]